MRPFISILALTMVLGASASFNYAECIEDCVKEVTSNNNKSPQHIKPHHDGAKQAASGKDKPPQDIEKIRRDCETSCDAQLIKYMGWTAWRAALW